LTENIEKIRKELDSVLVEAVRPTAQLGVENLIACELARAVFSKPLEKIRHILEAYLLISNEKRRELLGICDDEHEELIKIYKLCLDLQRTIFMEDRYCEMRTAAIPWSFTAKEIYKYLDWIGNFVPYHYPLVSYYKKLDYMKKFYYASKLGNLTWMTAREVQTRFIQYAMPKVIRIMRLLLEKIVTPEIWWQSLQIISGKVKVKERDQRAALQSEA